MTDQSAKKTVRVGRGGFTLLELIAGLLLAAILGLMLVALTHRTVTDSATPAITLTDACNLLAVVENMRADYTNDLGSLSASIGAEGTSQNNRYGEYEVLENSLIGFTGNSEDDTGTNVLRITVRGGTGETITRLFSDY